MDLKTSENFGDWYARLVVRRPGVTPHEIIKTCRRRTPVAGRTARRPIVGRLPAARARRDFASCDPRLVTSFGCATCGAVLTGALVEVPMPNRQVDEVDNRSPAPPRMLPGTFAVDPLPFGPPYVPMAEDSKVRVSDGSRRTILTHPDDDHGLRHHPDARQLNGCCRLDGLDGPNLVCTPVWNRDRHRTVRLLGQLA
jgi:hypothetical protein